MEGVDCTRCIGSIESEAQDALLQELQKKSPEQMEQHLSLLRLEKTRFLWALCSWLELRVTLPPKAAAPGGHRAKG